MNSSRVDCHFPAKITPRSPVEFFTKNHGSPAIIGIIFRRASMKSSCVVWRWIPTNDFPTSVNSLPRWIHSWLCHHRPTFPRRLDRTTIPRKIPSSKSAAKSRTKAKCPRSSTVKPKRRSGVRRARKRTANRPRSGTRKPSNPQRRYPTPSRLRPKLRRNRPTRRQYFMPNAFSGIKRKKRGLRPAARGVVVARA